MPLADLPRHRGSLLAPHPQACRSLLQGMSKHDGKTVQQRFHERYEIDPVSGCWNWTAGLNGKGYAYIWTGPNRKGDTKQAYKVGWEFKHGPVPDSKELHHTCENPRCVNPDHLQLLTRKQHCRLDSSVVALNARKTHCKRGHKFTTENTYTNPKGSRVCRVCQWQHRVFDTIILSQIRRASKRFVDTLNSTQKGRITLFPAIRFPSSTSSSVSRPISTCWSSP